MSSPHAQLDRWVGTWELAAFVGGQQVMEGRTTFEWLEGGAYLVQRSDGKATPDAPRAWHENTPFPTTAVIGLDGAKGTFTMLYADARQVFRVYEMSVDGDVWTIQREAPGFWQRFTGTFSDDDGSTITGYWEMSEDGSEWRRDFDLTHTRV